MNRMMKWFRYGHLPPQMQNVSRPCCDVATTMDEMLEESAEKTAGLRLLLQAKDCFVRCAVEAAEPKTGESES